MPDGTKERIATTQCENKVDYMTPPICDDLKMWCADSN